jgi:hypothetical protein
MTRAKKALYCLTAKGRNDKNAGNWLERTFPGDGDRREAGDKMWFNAYPVAQIPSPVSDRPLPLTLHSSPATRHSTSLPPSRRVTPRASHIIGRAGSCRFGTEIHRLLADIAWLDDAASVGGDGPAAEAVRKFTSSANGKKIFTKPSTPTDLWRERSFDVIDDGELLSGVFDRVHVTRKDGQPVSAHIYDFKTDGDSEDLQARYGEQLGIYRRAASRLLNLPLDQVTAVAVGVASR